MLTRSRGLVLPAWICVFLVGGSILVASPAGAAGPAEPEGDRFFREKIRPVLEASCFGCHSSTATKLKGGLLLDSREALLRGGDTGPAVVPGNVGESLLIQAIRHSDGLEMPPKKPKLAASVIDDFTRWVNLGAPFPDSKADSASPDEAPRHWSFLPVNKTRPPQVRETAWVRTPVDAFVMAKLEARGWKPAPAAEKHVLIRRVTFDLTGLPPTPEEVSDFVNDDSPETYERVVDRLLASPR